MEFTLVWRGWALRSMDFKLLDFPSNINEEITENITRVVNSNFWSTGPESKIVEDHFTKIYKRRCITTSSGGSALQLIHDAYKNVKRIAIQSNTYFATSLPWVNSNKEIFLMGSHSYSLMPSIEIVKNVIQKGIDALIITHIGGYPNPNIELIAELCSNNGVILIEDCAHSPLVKINKKLVGTFGDAAILSFYPTKPIPAGEGGLAIIKNKSKAFEIEKMRDYGKSKDENGSTRHLLPAFPNARLNEFAACIVNTILRNYISILNAKKKVSNLYHSKLDNNLLLTRIYPDDLEIEASYYKFICFLEKSKYQTAPVYDRENQLISIFRDNNINFEFIGDKEFAYNHICLPITCNMTEKDIDEILNNTD
ncbi:DegT/DnrJ/EryC1/StrS family aminotransferase [Prochlorococcus sp. AH-716-K03]|nr:DegT/DnrJ/EryC1/StrS family aminotransferase [Prochlorococcus sp. AH-716-K03]